MVADGSPGNHFQLDRAAVPALRDAFADALAKVSRQVELANSDLRLSPWANDPVSADATAAFNACAVGSGESALSQLEAYRTQLGEAVEALDRTATQYHVSDEDSSVTVGKQEGTGD